MYFRLRITISNSQVMRFNFMNIIVTGGAGFIGSNFIFHMLKSIRTTALSVWIS